MQKWFHQKSIEFSEFHFYMRCDPYYGVNKNETESLITHIESEDENFSRFSTQFNSLPCKNDKQRHLIYLWCGLMGLPAYRNGIKLDWRWNDYLKNWTQDFDLKLDDIKSFLRQHSWPLIVYIFPDEVDNTERITTLSQPEYENARHSILEELPRLKKEMADIESIQPKDFDELKKKKNEIEKIEGQITTITAGRYKGKDESPAERKRRLEIWYEEEISRSKSGALNRTAAREGITRQTLSKILKR